MATVSHRQLSSAAARVTLTRSDRRNATNPQMAREFASAAAAVTDAGARIVVLDAEGPAFCAGADLTELPEAGDALYAMIETLVSTPVYWLAAVRGAVRGGGLSLLAACPGVLATPSSSFALPELARGFFPVSVVEGLAEVIGERRAFEMAFGVDALDAEQAVTIGLASRTVADDELEEQLSAELRRLEDLDGAGLAEGVARWQARMRKLLEPGEALRAQ